MDSISPAPAPDGTVSSEAEPPPLNGHAIAPLQTSSPDPLPPPEIVQNAGNDTLVLPSEAPTDPSAPALSAEVPHISTEAGTSGSLHQHNAKRTS